MEPSAIPTLKPNAIPMCEPSADPTFAASAIPTLKATTLSSAYAPSDSSTGTPKPPAEIDSISVLYESVDETVGVASVEATIFYKTVPEAGTRVHCAGYLVVDGVASSAPTSVYEVVQRGASATVPMGSKVVVVTLMNLFAASEYK